MVRLTVAAAAMVMITACSGLIDDGGDGGLTAEQIRARDLWVTKALPALRATNTNCTSCHDGSRENIGFIVGATDLAARDTILAYEPQVVNLDAPASSRLLTKGPHEGPSLDATPAADLLEWLEAEKVAAGSTGDPVPLIEVPRFFPKICTNGLPDEPTAPNPNCLFNIVKLDDIGVPGGSIKFIVQALGSGLYMTNLKLEPDVMGAYIEHPLFVTWPADATGRSGCEKTSDGTFCADTIDRFFSVKMNLMKGATETDKQIGGGTAAFVGFLATDQLSIHFKAVSPFVSDGTMPPAAVGCKKLPEFKTNVAGAMQTNCASCHAGTANANAKSAMNLDGVNAADDPTVQKACNEVYNRVNLTDTVNSGILLATDPAGNANHPFKFNGNAANYTTFKNSANIWIQAEKTAP